MQELYLILSYRPCPAHGHRLSLPCRLLRLFRSVRCLGSFSCRSLAAVRACPRILTVRTWSVLGSVSFARSERWASSSSRWSSSCSSCAFDSALALSPAAFSSAKLSPKPASSERGACVGVKPALASLTALVICSGCGPEISCSAQGQFLEKHQKHPQKSDTSHSRLDSAIEADLDLEEQYKAYSDGGACCRITDLADTMSFPAFDCLARVCDESETKKYNIH